MKITTGRELETIQAAELLVEYLNACLRQCFTGDASDKEALIKYAKDHYDRDIDEECYQHLVKNGVLPPTRNGLGHTFEE
jgi:hypothetical protein